MRRFGILTSLVASVAIVSSAAAVVFPDVPNGHLFKEAIEQLVGAGVVKGNPDGLFHPERTVNRAELLKMLYLAEGKVPEAGARGCFADVDPGSWYEPYVCDAAANMYVKGYADGKFRPANTVNRAEALKMVQEVLGFDKSGITEADRSIIKFVDVSVSAWYSDYLSNAYRVGILPIPGQAGDRFGPEMGLSRGEAAAYVWNAIRSKLSEDRGQTMGASSSSRPSSAGLRPASSAAPSASIFNINYPFSVNGKFTERKPMAYLFTLDRDTVIETTALLQSRQPGTLRCTLFKQEASGLSFEYYVGKQEAEGCYLLTSLEPGSYQLLLQPSNPGVTFTAETKGGSGDGNDGFSEAQPVYFNTAKSYALQSYNMHNWYRFSVTEPEGQRFLIELTNAQNLTCLIYPMDDVDLFGFQGPECNQYYLYPPGTYYVGIGRRAIRGSTQSYTIRLLP